MAYENINVYKLKSSLNKIDNISSSKITSLANNLSVNHWSGASRGRIKIALDKLASEYGEITKETKRFKTVADYIDEYKDLEKQNDTYNRKITYYKALLLMYLDESQAYQREQTKRKIQECKNRISNNNSRKNQLVNQINNLIN